MRAAVARVPGRAANSWMLCGGIRAVATSRDDGDLSQPGTRARLVDRPWTVLRQVHGDRVVRVASPGDHAGQAADAAVTAGQGAVLSVLTADCAPVAFASPEGIAGVAHAGWRGLAAGVIGATVGAMHDLGATRVEAVVGPCIGPECYAFSPDDLDNMAARLGPAVRAVDRTGRPALDLAAGVAVALERSGVHIVAIRRICTGCSAHYWSWRARRDTARQGMIVWRP